MEVKWRGQMSDKVMYFCYALPGSRNILCDIPGGWCNFSVSLLNFKERVKPIVSLKLIKIKELLIHSIDILTMPKDMVMLKE